MAKRAITNELYGKLLESFRQYPGEYARAARHASCDPRTAARAWKTGWVKQNKAWAPIGEVLEQEKLAARARMNERTAVVADEQRTIESVQMQAEREKAARDAVEARGQEAQMVRLLRSDVTAGLAAVARTLPGVQKWASWAAEQMQARDPATLREVTRMMEALSRITERTAGAADRVMAMERRLLGQPEQIIGMALPEITLAEAVEHIEAAQETLEYARECGLLPPAENDAHGIVDAEWTEPENELEARGAPAEELAAVG